MAALPCYFPAISFIIHMKLSRSEEEDDNNEGVSEHYDSQFTMMGTLAYETGNNGVLTWGSLEANTNTTKTNKEDMSSTTIQLLVDGPKVPPLLPPLATNPRCKMH